MSIRDPLTRRHVTFRGRVQGVGFRWYVKGTADVLGLSGWVCNKDDGSVEAEIQGSEGALDEFIRCSKTGNPAARVDEITTRPLAFKEEAAFTII